MDYEALLLKYFRYLGMGTLPEIPSRPGVADMTPEDIDALIVIRAKAEADRVPVDRTFHHSSSTWHGASKIA